MTDEILRELIEFIENASPVVWSTLVKQVYVDAISTLAWAVLLVILAVMAYKYAGKVRKQDGDRDEWHEEKLMIGYIATVVCTVGAFALFTTALMHLVNPEFYAIKLILTLISG